MRDPALRPSRAVRLDRAPRPVLRPLSDVLAELRAAAAARAREHAAAPTPPRAVPDPERAAAQARPFAVRVLGAAVEILDGRRPVGHLGGVCAAEDAERLIEHLTARRRPGGAMRLAGLRLCGVDDDAVEAAAVLHGPTRSRAICARLVRAPDTRSGWRLATLVVL